MSVGLGSVSKLSSESMRGVPGSGELVAELAAELSADPQSGDGCADDAGDGDGDGARICTAGTGGRACCTMSSSSACAWSPGLSLSSTLDARERPGSAQLRRPSLLRRAISGPNSRTGAGSQLPSASAPSDGESMSGPLMQRAIYGGCAATSLPAGDCGAPGLRPSPNPKPSPWLGLGRICRLRLLSKSELSRLIRGEPVRGDLRDEPRGESAGEPDGDTNTGRPFVIDATYACAGVGVGVGSAPGTVCDVRRIVLGAVIDFCCAKGAAGGVRKRTW
jgi:hypothetical protein